MGYIFPIKRFQKGFAMSGFLEKIFGSKEKEKEKEKEKKEGKKEKPRTLNEFSEDEKTLDGVARQLRKDLDKEDS